MNSTLTETVSRTLSPRRAAHTLSVAEEITRLGAYLSLSAERMDELEKAALLHDITKEKSFEEQLLLCERYGVTLTEADRLSRPTLHAVTGAAVAARDFGLSPVGCDAIRYHSTGRAVMTLEEKLLFTADYIEPLRPYDDCRMKRRLLYEAWEKTTDLSERLAFFDQTVYTIADYTIGYLLSRRCYIHPDTLSLRNALLIAGALPAERSLS